MKAMIIWALMFIWMIGGATPGYATVFHASMSNKLVLYSYCKFDKDHATSVSAQVKYIYVS